MPGKPDPMTIEQHVEWRAKCTQCKGELISTSRNPWRWWHKSTSLPECPSEYRG